MPVELITRILGISFVRELKPLQGGAIDPDFNDTRPDGRIFIDEQCIVEVTDNGGLVVLEGRRNKYRRNEHVIAPDQVNNAHLGRLRFWGLVTEEYTYRDPQITRESKRGFVDRNGFEGDSPGSYFHSWFPPYI